MSAPLPHEVEAVIRAHGERAYPEECVGALLADAGGPVLALPLENGALERRRGFELSAREYLHAETEAQRRGLTLCGFYHSHPDAPAVPSARDLEHGAAFAWMVIVAVEFGRATTLSAAARTSTPPPR